MENNSEGVQYFLARIEEFEKAYKMKSWRFQLLYENSPKALPGYNGQAAVDYSEWSFLCENFPHLNSTFCESPPWDVTDTDQQRPESFSGFCFVGGKCDYFGAPILGSCREHASGQKKRKCHGRYRSASLSGQGQSDRCPIQGKSSIRKRSPSDDFRPLLD